MSFPLENNIKEKDIFEKDVPEHDGFAKDGIVKNISGQNTTEKDLTSKKGLNFNQISETVFKRWHGNVTVHTDYEESTIFLSLKPAFLREICNWLFCESGYCFAGIIPEETDHEWVVHYIFYGSISKGQVNVKIQFPLAITNLPSISMHVHAADWQEREIKDLFGLVFDGHPRLGNFVLHEKWPDGVNPMRRDFDGKAACTKQDYDSNWHPVKVLEASGSFTMPIGPVFADHAESAHFLLETVGEDVIRTIPRFFYKYRGLEKIAERQHFEKVCLLAERFSGTSAFAHSLAFTGAVEKIAGTNPSPRTNALRVLIAELERIRHHASVIAGICSSTALGVAAAQAEIIEENLLRLSCDFTGHRYFFGLNVPGGLCRDFSNENCIEISEVLWGILDEFKELHNLLRFTSSFLDRLEDVGIVLKDEAVSYGLVGPVARASGVSGDLRIIQPYAGYDKHLKFNVPRERQGDGYARLRVLFSEIEQSTNLIRQISHSLPTGQVRKQIKIKPGSAIGRVEAPTGAAFHFVRLDEKDRVVRYRIISPSFINWHGFHIAAENFAFQDFPIIMATFGLSNAECDR